MASARRHDAALRERLVQRAGDTIARDGAGAVSLRALAAAEGTSTTAVYSLFGGKDGLMAAVFSDAFDRFLASQEAAPVTGEFLADVFALGWAYWDWATANPGRYRIMFGGVLGGYDPGPELMEDSLRSLEPLRRIVVANPERFRAEPETAVALIWAVVHGTVSLVLASCLPGEYEDRRGLYAAALEALADGVIVR